MKEQVSKSVDDSAGDKGMKGVDAKQQPRQYDPLDQAAKGKVSDSLNSDAARYKQGPGPV